MIQYVAENIKMPVIEKHKLNRWIKEIAADYGKKTGDIAYIFCTDERILEMNKQYLDHDYYTDIITFDYTEGNTISGDIFISLDTVKSNSEEFGTGFEAELHRILIHGVLHLCGQDDKTPLLRAEMTEKENRALEKL
ncbi:MAG: rRNA maturation RNase YbeY [Bacteroidales bacterium]|nr:rRNA maturation RNase YbeY [Bacteroidales bacterium]